MNILDPSVKELVTAAFSANNDVYLFPDSVYLEKELVSFCKDLPYRFVCLVPKLSMVMRSQSFSEIGVITKTPQGVLELKGEEQKAVYFAEYSVLGCEGLFELFKRLSVHAAVILNAELALRWEYGYKRVYEYFGEHRASSLYPVNAVFLCSGALSDFELNTLTQIYASQKYTAVGIKKQLKLEVTRFNSSKEKYDRAVREAKRYCAAKTVFFCSTRREAEELSRTAFYKGVKLPYIHGGRTEEQNESIVKEMIEGRLFLAVGTKTMLPYCADFAPERVFYCGMPYSLKQLEQTAFYTGNSRIGILYTAEDIEQNIRVSKAWSQTMPFEERNVFLRYRYKNMSALLDLMAESQ